MSETPLTPLSQKTIEHSVLPVEEQERFDLHEPEAIDPSLWHEQDARNDARHFAVEAHAEASDGMVHPEINEALYPVRDRIVRTLQRGDVIEHARGFLVRGEDLPTAA